LRKALRSWLTGSLRSLLVRAPMEALLRLRLLRALHELRGTLTADLPRQTRMSRRELLLSLRRRTTSTGPLRELLGALSKLL
jgi:hypothetical protein